jgi:hypothetical protein
MGKMEPVRYKVSTRRGRTIRMALRGNKVIEVTHLGKGEKEKVMPEKKVRRRPLDS